jgi:hypothetical protein
LALASPVLNLSVELDEIELASINRSPARHSTVQANCVALAAGYPALRSASLVGMAPLPRVTEQPVAIRGTASALRCGRCARGAGRDYLMMMSKSRLSQPDRHGEREHHDGQSSQHPRHGIFPPQIRLIGCMVRRTRRTEPSKAYRDEPKNPCMNPG